MNRAATVALAPLSSLYGAAMKARRALYRHGVLRVHDAGVPVISIGNITTGGTGKTPLVEWIAGELACSNHQVCILTRGYGRRHQNRRVIVSNGSEILSDAETSGDEAFLLAERLYGRAAVISDADRLAAAHWAILNLHSDVLVFDDGFQHLRIRRSLNIVSVDATNPWGNRRLLPAGSLREPLAELARADCIVITRVDESARTGDLQREINRLTHDRIVFRSRMKTCRLRPVNRNSNDINRLMAGTEVKSMSLAAFCGIGNPKSFFAHLQRDGYTLCHTQAFRDHHSYTQPDIDRFARDSIARGAQALLTTAKDEVKLRSLRFDLPCYVADITIEIEDEDDLRMLIDEAIRSRARQN
jgi:tetraacyldisaccharide 4'-kinase